MQLAHACMHTTRCTRANSIHKALGAKFRTINKPMLLCIWKRLLVMLISELSVQQKLNRWSLAVKSDRSQTIWTRANNAVAVLSLDMGYILYLY